MSSAAKPAPPPAYQTATRCSPGSRSLLVLAGLLAAAGNFLILLDLIR